MFAAGMVNLPAAIHSRWGGATRKGEFLVRRALAGPVTAYIYDWNPLPIGQVLWLKELESRSSPRPFRIRRATT